jgi:hypothetical protein
MQNASEFNVQAANQELLEFYQFLPSLNFEALEQGGFNDALKRYYEVASALAVAEPSPLAHSILAVLHAIGGNAPFYDLEKVKDERRNAGYLGHGIAMYDYCNQVRLADDVALAFLQILAEENAGAAGIKDEYAYQIKKLDDARKAQIATLANEIRHNYTAKGLAFFHSFSSDFRVTMTTLVHQPRASLPRQGRRPKP